MRPRGYGQFCPVALASEILTERWTPLVLRELLGGSRRFNELRRGVPLMSPSLLSQRLRALTEAGVIRRVPAGDRARGEYHLTGAGEELRPVIEAMSAWAMRWARGRITRHDLDPAFLMWAILRKAQAGPDRLPENRVVVMFDFPDADRGKRYWWLVLCRPEADLCLTDPGFETDLRLRTDLRTMAGVALGEQTVAAAVRGRVMGLEGTARCRKAIGRWLGLDP